MRTIALRASLLHVRKREAVSGKAGFVAKDTVTAIGRCQGKRIMKKCVFAGTFDPPTLGHRAVVERAKKVFDEVIVAILVNPDKKPLFTVAERMELLKKTMPFAEVKIISSEKTAADLMKETGADCYLRGIRNGTDFDYETANYYVSEKLCGEFIAMYVPCPQDLLHVSSSAVRAILKFGKSVDGYVANGAKDLLLALYEEKKRDGTSAKNG